MNQILSAPERFYDYIHTQYGTVGLIVSGVLVVVACTSIMIWFDRRK